MEHLALLSFVAILALPANAQQGAALLTPELRAMRLAGGDMKRTASSRRRNGSPFSRNV